MLFRIIKAKSLFTGGLFFIMVFVVGLLWALAKFGGLADAFIFRNTLN